MAARWTLSGFGDEIDPDPAVQCAVLQALGAKHVEVRSAWGTNIVELCDERTAELAGTLTERGMRVSAIASPVGKVDITTPLAPEFARLVRAVRAAHALDCRYIRLFSFYRAAGETPENIRDEVLVRMSAFADFAGREGVILLHENEKGVYGDVPERVVDIVESVGSPNLRVAWDSANFVQVGVRPFVEAYAMLRPYLEYLQLKDARFGTGEVVPVGEGDGELFETLTALRDDGYAGFASLEPHLGSVDALGGFSGPEAFARAAHAFAGLADELGVELV